jgi:hypothetical protein
MKRREMIEQFGDFNHQQIVNVSKENRDDQRVFDIYISLRLMPHDRMLVEITEKQSVQTLQAKIVDNLQMKYELFKGLRGVRVTRMEKFTPLYQNNKQEIMIYKEGQQEEINFKFKDEMVRPKLDSRDHLFVDIDSQD